MHARTLWKLCALAGLGVAILAVFLLPMFPKTGAADLSGYGGPVFAFEAAQSPSDLTAIFGAAGDPLRTERIAQMDKGNYWDFLFMTLYGLFSALFFAAIFAKSKRRIWLLFAGLGLLSGVMDAWENTMLLEISANIDNSPSLAMLSMAVWGKFFSIAANIMAAGAYLWSRPKLIWKILGAIAFLGALSVPIAFSNPAEYGWTLQNGVAAAWIIMSLYAYARSVDKFWS